MPPAFTVARDDTSDDVRILTEHNMEEYKNVWKPLMPCSNLKWLSIYKRFEDCKAESYPL